MCLIKFQDLNFLSSEDYTPSRFQRKEGFISLSGTGTTRKVTQYLKEMYNPISEDLDGGLSLNQLLERKNRKFSAQMLFETMRFTKVSLRAYTNNPEAKPVNHKKYGIDLLQLLSNQTANFVDFSQKTKKNLISRLLLSSPSLQLNKLQLKCKNANKARAVVTKQAL